MTESVVQYGRKYPTGRIDWDTSGYIATPEARRDAADSFRYDVESSGVILTDDIRITFVTRTATYTDPVDLPPDPEPPVDPSDGPDGLAEEEV